MSEKDAPTAISKDQHALRFIRGAILSGRYGPEARITASQVAKEAGISVGPIREAMRRLEAEGLIVYQPNMGATVIGMNYRVLSDTLSTLALLEAAATAAAAPLLTESDLAELGEINESMRAADERGDVVEVSRQNRLFHAKSYSTCPNAWLLDLIAKTASRSFVGRRSLFFDSQHRSHLSVVEHQNIIRLIREKASAEQVEKAVRDHKQPTLDIVAARAAMIEEDDLNHDFV